MSLSAICHRCPHVQPPPYTGPCACTIDQRDIRAHAAADYCPDPAGARFGTGVAPANWADVPVVDPAAVPAQSQPAPDPLSSDARALVAAESAGLGDDVERLAKALGADKLAAVISELTGWNCGCDARKALLNKLPSLGQMWWWMAGC